MSIVPYVFLDVVRFSLAWPPTASSVVVSVEVARLFLCRVSCCQYLLGHTVPHEVSRFSTSEAVIISAVIILSWVCFFLLFSKELLYRCSKDFHLSCHFCFGVVTGLWLGHHEPCFVPFGCVYCHLQRCWCCRINYGCHG